MTLCGDLDGWSGGWGGQREVQVGDDSCSVVSDSLPPHVTVAHQAPLSVGFCRQVLDWVAVPPLGDLLHPGIELGPLCCR